MNKYQLAPLSVAISLALISNVSQAESTQDHDQYLLDSITITSIDKTKEQAVRAVQAISTVDSAMIKNIASKNVPAALRILPNVDVLGGPTPSNENISIRGLPQSHAYVSIDGIYQSNFATKRGSWSLNPNFLKSIQVTAGPTSGAAAGKITIETISALDLLAPGDTFGAKIDYGYRSNNAQSDIGLSLFGLADTLDYLVAVQTSDRDAYEIGGIGGVYDKTRGNQDSALVKIGQQFNDDQRLVFSLNYDDSRTFQVKQDIGFRDTKYIGSSLVWTDKVSGNDLIDFSASLYFNHVDSYSWEEKDDDIQGVQDIQDKSWGYTVSNNSLTDFGLVHFGTSGHFTAHEGLTVESVISSQEIIEDDSATSEATTDAVKLRAWVNVQIPVGDSFEIIPGIRYDSFNIKSPNAIGLEGEPLLREGRTESRVSKSLNGIYYFNDNIKFFASYAEAINNPGNGELFTSGRGFKPNPELKSERADNKEIGVVFDYQNVFVATDSLVTRVNIFRNDIKDYISDIYSVDWPDGEKVNIGEAQLKGFEITTSYHFDDLDLSASYGRTRGIDKNTGWYLSEMPSDKINFVANYQFNDELTAGTSATFAFNHSAVPTEQLVEGGGSEEIPAEDFTSWFSMDIFATYQPAMFKGLSTKLSVTNLLDRGYAQRNEYERDGAVKNPVEFYEEGRSINLSVSYSF